MSAVAAALLAMSPALLFMLDPSRANLFPGGSSAPFQFVVGFVAINAIFSGFAIVIGLSLEPSVGMGLPLLRRCLSAKKAEKRATGTTVICCFLLAVVLGITVLACGITLQPQLPPLPENFVFLYGQAPHERIAE